MRIVNTSVAGTGASPSTIWNRPPSIGLMTSQRGDPPPPSSVANTRCLPRRVIDVIRRAGSSVQALEPALVSVVERFPKVSGGGQPYLSAALNQALEQAEKEADRLKDEYISTEHLLLALADNKLMREAGAAHDGLLKALKQIRGNQRVTDQNPESKYQALEKYGRDLTKLAAEGKLDPVIGRDEEIRRVIQVLSRRTKNNPVLIGEPGVGKTAIAE